MSEVQRAKQVDRIGQYLCFKNRERTDTIHYQNIIEKTAQIDKVIHGWHVEKKNRIKDRDF